MTKKTDVGTIDVGTIKEKLCAYSDLKVRVLNLVERIDNLNAAMLNAPVPVLSSVPRGCASSTDKIGDRISKKEGLLLELKQLQQMEIVMYKELDDMIRELHSPDEELVLEMRYLDGLPWWPICAALFERYPDYNKRYEAYLKRTFKLHGAALQALAKLNAKQEADSGSK